MKEFIKEKEKGITLIALVITIIILLILAGVTIATLTGDNGIITKAQEARQKTEDAAKKEQQQLAGVFERNYATYNGQLHVDGAYLKNSFNEDIQLKGIYYGYGNSKYSKAILTTLKNWEINMIKVGYNYSGGEEPWNKEGNMDSLYQFIDTCIELDLYVDVIFWSGNDLYETNYDKINEANQFFTNIANKYKDSNNIIYEICNEPFENTWEEIKTYSINVIDTIRNINSNAIILVPNVSNDLSILYTDSTIDRENIMYTAHIYSDRIIEKQRTAVQAVLRGIPVFISEWSNVNGSATGYNNEITNKLIEVFNKYNISNSAWYFPESGKIQTDLTMIKNEYFNEVVETGKIDDNMLGIAGTYLKAYLAQQGRNTYNYSEEDYTWVIKSASEESSYFYNEKYTNNIVKFITQSNMDIPSNFIDLWDISHNGMGTIIAYLVPNEQDTEKYNLYICSDKMIITDNVMGILGPGKFISLEFVDLSNVDTKNAESFHQTFSGCSNLEEIRGVEKFDTKNVNTMHKMFQNCHDIIEIDLSNWDTNKVTDMQEMFVNCSSLEILNLKNADFSNVTNYNNMFYGINENITIYVKDDNAKQWVTQALIQSGISTDTTHVIISE